jgi:hypothetical protein
MVEYPGAPNVSLDLSCKGKEEATSPDVIVDITTQDGEAWVRLPVTAAEVMMNKDGPADLNRTGKVKMPAEWNGESVVQYLNGFNQQVPTVENPLTGEDVPLENPYDLCRIYFRDQDDGIYDIVHFGYVGGVGPAAEDGVVKFWVYDPADLMRGIQVSKSFDQPTIQQVLNFALEGTDDNGRAVGLNQRSVFTNIRTTIAGLQTVALQKADKRQGFFGGFVDTEGAAPSPFNTGSGLLGVEDFFDDAWDILTEVTEDLLGGGVKRFQLNRHNMVDLMNWFADEVGGKWHFEPDDEGPVLFFDNTADSNPEVEGNEGEIARRRFVATEVDGEEDDGPFSDMPVFDTFDQLDNNALYDIKPFNTLYLYGETSTPAERNPGRSDTASGPGVYTEEFPFVKVVYPPLVDRAGGYEYAPSAVESDKIFLDNAASEAVKQFRKNVEEETEGSLEVKGTPHLLPYDYITTVPACGDIYENVNADPITYEINRVTHRRAAGERYRTDLGVSLVVDETELEISKEMRDA